MTYMREILAVKGSSVITISPDATVLDAAVTMNEQKIGCLVVTVGDTVRGIFTERDILRRVVAQRRDPVDTRVEEVMTEEVACVGLETSVDDARNILRAHRIRHLPVVDEGRRIAGLVSIGDLNAHLSQNLEVEVRYLHEYLNGEAAAPVRH